MGPTLESDTKTLVLACASTGAKFTPKNHRETGNDILDAICTGATIKTAPLQLTAEVEALYAMGCRYYHYHARNPLSREQSTDNEIYQLISSTIQQRCPGMFLSFGASRNGHEVRENIARFGEWERVSQSGIPLHLGGAHFVTLQAAVELQIICDLERSVGAELVRHGQDLPEFRAAVLDHVPAVQEVDAALEAYTTSHGAQYGRTSPAIQAEVYANAIANRRRLGLFDEIEWVQYPRSRAMARYAIEHPAFRLGSSGQLNITILFGFSPRLQVPLTYDEFRQIVQSAKSLEYDIGSTTPTRTVSITVGAAVMPQDAEPLCYPLDVGSESGRVVGPLRRIAAYAAQPDSGVDILRVGMEDTPFAHSSNGAPTLTDNCELLAVAIDEISHQRARSTTDMSHIRAVLGIPAVEQVFLDMHRSLALGENSPNIPAPIRQPL